MMLAAFPQQLGCSHFVSGNTEAEAGHRGLGYEGTHLEGANDLKKLFGDRVRAVWPEEI